MRGTGNVRETLRDVRGGGKGMGIGPGAVGSGSLHQCGHRNSIVDLECVEAQESVSLVSGSGGNRRPPPPLLLASLMFVLLAYTRSI